MGEEGQLREQQHETLSSELKAALASLYTKIEKWVRPDPSQPLFVQMLLFILKLPVLLFLLLISPVVLIILLFVFVVAL